MSAKGVVVHCDDPEELLKRVSLTIMGVNDIKDVQKSFETQIMDAGNGKIGAANQKLLDQLVEVGGKDMDNVINALIVDLKENIMEPGFAAHLAMYGTRSQYDTQR